MRNQAPSTSQTPEIQNSRTPEFKSSRDPEIQKSRNPRNFTGPLRPLLSEEEKSTARIEELTFDFACRITRLYKYLNEGNLHKADRDIIDAYGKQMLRSASSINANINEAQHPQSDSDFLSKSNIALKEARETNNWLNLFYANGYLEDIQYNSLSVDISRILRILTMIVGKVSTRLKQAKKKN